MKNIMNISQSFSIMNPSFNHGISNFVQSPQDAIGSDKFYN